jgi:protein-tyrosine-phosphatase
MAEGILRHHFEAVGIQSVNVSSMGVHGLDSVPATKEARQVCEENGIDISAHRSRPIVSEEIQDADMVFCMEPMHQKFLQTFFPWHKEQIVLLAAWPGKPTRKSFVADPMGKPIDVYRKIFAEIAGHIDRVVEDL